MSFLCYLVPFHRSLVQRVPHRLALLVREHQADVGLAFSRSPIFYIFTLAKPFSSFPLLPGFYGLLAIVMVFWFNLGSLVILRAVQAAREPRNWITSGQGILFPVWDFKFFFLNKICPRISFNFVHVALYEFLCQIDFALSRSPEPSMHILVST